MIEIFGLLVHVASLAWFCKFAIYDELTNDWPEGIRNPPKPHGDQE